MERIDPELERLLEKARGGEDPTLQDRDRNLDALARRVGTVALLGAAAVTTSDVAASAVGATKGVALAAKAGVPTALALAFKVGAPLVLIGAVGTVLVPRIIGRHATSAPDVALGPTALAHDVPTKSSEGQVEAAPTPEPSAAPEPAPVAKPASPAFVPAVPPSGARAPALADEVALLQRAEGALRDGKPEQALSVLSEHARQFPRGELRAERTAARIAALCALHRQAEARRDAASFLRQWPGSPLAAQVRASCAAPDDKATMP
jgi:hypothetical protein